MNQTVLPPVATPWRYRWRAFRTKFLPGLIFLGCVLAIAALWRRSATAPTFVAEAEATRAEIGALGPGRISSLKVALLQAVKAGEVVAEVAPVAPEIAQATLAVIRAEIDLLRQSLAPAVDQQRVVIDFFRLQLDWMRERVALAALRAKAQQSEADLRRATTLHEKKLVSDESFEATQSQHHRLAGQIAEQSALVEQLTPAAQQPALPPIVLADALAAGIRVQEEKLRLTELQVRPVILLTPIDGVVTLLHRHEGEVVVAGQPVATIVAHRPSRLVGFLRQPLAAEPRRDARAEVRTRSPDRRSAAATVLEIGHALEPVPSTLLGLVNRQGSPELGLRVHLSVPAQLHLHPGEQVDVILNQAGQTLPVLP